MRIACLLSVLLLVLVSVAPAQAAGDPPSRDLAPIVQRMLRSDSLAVQAWGAHLAGRQVVKAAIPDLKRILTAPDSERTQRPRMTRYAAWDAMIRLGGELSAAEAAKIQSPLEPAIVLLGRDAAKNQAALLALLGRGRLRLDHWTAICNLLAPRRTPGLAAWLVSTYRVHLSFAVADEQTIGVGDGVYGGAADAMLQVPEDFPPIRFYWLREKKCAPVDNLFAAGTVPIFLHLRDVEPGRPAGWGYMLNYRRENERRLAFLAAMADVDAKTIKLPARDTHNFVWEGPEKFQASVAEARAKLDARLAAVNEMLAAKGLLTKEEAQRVRPTIVTKMTDVRKVKQPPLPKIVFD